MPDAPTAEAGREREGRPPRCQEVVIPFPVGRVDRCCWWWATRGGAGAGGGFADDDDVDPDDDRRRLCSSNA